MLFVELKIFFLSLLCTTHDLHYDLVLYSYCKYYVSYKTCVSLWNISITNKCGNTAYGTASELFSYLEGFVVETKVLKENINFIKHLT